jgi:hypothetical protein
MEKVLHQKKFQEFKKYTITEEYLIVEIKSSSQYNKFDLDYEFITNKESIVRDEPTTYILGLCSSLILNLLLLWIMFYDKLSNWNIGTGGLSGITGGIIAGVSVLSSKEFKYRKLKILDLTNNSGIYFYYNKEKQRQEVDQFIIDLKEAKRNYIRKKYFLLDELLSLEELEYQFKWLYRDKYISKSEYDFMMEELQARKLF